MANEIVTGMAAQFGRVTEMSRAEPVRGIDRRQNVAGSGQAEAHAAAGQAAETPVAKERLERALESLNDLAQNHQRSLQFTIDENSGRTIIRVVDPQTKEVIRQIPPEEVVKLAQRVGDSAGMLLRAEA